MSAFCVGLHGTSNRSEIIQSTNCTCVEWNRGNCDNDFLSRIFPHVFNLFGPIFMMGPSDRQQKMLLELVVKCIVPTVCAALQIHFILMVAILLQHQKVKQEADLAIQEKNRALRRYRQYEIDF